MFPDSGGPELWVTKALGKKWGFMTAWLLWVHLFPGAVMGSSVLAPLLGETFNIKSLETSRTAVLVCILAAYWIMTIVNIKFDVAKAAGKIGVWLGLYIPSALIVILGAACFIKTGFSEIDTSTLGAFSTKALVPDFGGSSSSLAFFAPIMFIFTGIEISSVYIPRLKNPVKTYLTGVGFTLAFTFVFSLICAFLFAAVIPRGSVELNNIAYPVALFCHRLGLPSIIVNIFSFLVFIGMVVQAATWLTAPARTVNESAKRGMYPPSWGFWKTNKRGVSVPILMAQAVIVTLLAFVFILVPAVNDAFILLISAACIIYNLSYVLELIGIVRLRIKEPGIKRPFKAPLLFFCAALLLITIIFATWTSLANSSPQSALVMAGILVLVIVPPFFIMKAQKERLVIRGEGLPAKLVQGARGEQRK
jgi:amino acid transporter